MATLRRARRVAARAVSLASFLSVSLLGAAACGSSPTASPAPEPEVFRIEVASARSASPAVSPASAATTVGGGVQFVALDAAGQPVAVTWASSDPGVATVSASGLASGLRPGSVAVTARSRRSTASAQLTVSAPAPACRDLPHLRQVAVSTSAGLAEAVRTAVPGDLIVLADGAYTGRLSIGVSGTPERAIVLCGSSAAVLRTGAVASGGYALTLRASHWILQGFTVRESQMGIDVAGGHRNQLRGLEIHGTGQEALHIGSNSTHNRVDGVWIHDTGRALPEYGEGVYIGSYHGHWCARTACQPDRSDSNEVVGSRFGPNVTAEHIDVKEGTSGGVLSGNHFDGTGMVASQEWIDSWVIIHGSGYTVTGNTGSRSIRHGFRVQRILDGWGEGNVFDGNTADVQGPGYGFLVSSGLRGNRVACTNRVSNAASGLSNLACS